MLKENQVNFLNQNVEEALGKYSGCNRWINFREIVCHSIISMALGF